MENAKINGYGTFNFYNGDSKMSYLANSEDPDEMPHNAAFHQGLHCLPRPKPIFRKENTILFEKYNL